MSMFGSKPGPRRPARNPSKPAWHPASPRPARARSTSCAAASPKCSSAPNRFWKTSAPQCAPSAPPDVHVWVEARAEKAGAQSLEACMASSITQARDGSLYLMCGGKQEVFDRARPVLEKLSSSMRYIGAAGKAAQVKALVNMVMNINTAALAEGLGLANALGLDLAMVREVFSQTGANSRVLQTDGEDMQNREHSCFFSAAHAAKDSGIALKLGKALDLNLRSEEHTSELQSRLHLVC